jgi:hypothetical protein
LNSLARASTRSVNARFVLRKFGGDRHEPAAVVGEGDAFCEHLLRHDDRQVVAEVQIAGFLNAW